MAQTDDFGEVYAGQPEAASGDFEEDIFYANGQQTPALEAGEITAPETEDDIYTFSGDANMSSQQETARDVEEEVEDDDEDVQIVLNTESVEARGAGRGSATAPGSAGKGHYGRGGVVITAGWSGTLKRPQPLPGKTQQQKSVFELDLDSLEEKPWRKPGVDITDYFNYGFNEDSWRAYSEKQAQMRLEQSMQSKIKVYESAKDNTKSELPPELQAMVDGDKSKKRGIPPRRPVDDWQNRGGFDHRRRARDPDDAVIQINASMDMGDDMMRADRPDMAGMDEFYVPTFPRGGFPDYREERRREEERKRERRPSRSPPRRDDRDKERDRDRDKRRDERDRRDPRREGSAERDRRRERDEKEREEYKRKNAGTTREEDERAKRRR